MDTIAERTQANGIQVGSFVIAPFNIYKQSDDPHARLVKIGEGHKRARVIRGPDQLGRYMVDFGLRATKGKRSDTLVVYATADELISVP